MDVLEMVIMIVKGSIMLATRECWPESEVREREEKPEMESLGRAVGRGEGC